MLNKKLRLVQGGAFSDQCMTSFAYGSSKSKRNRMSSNQVRMSSTLKWLKTHHRLREVPSLVE